MKRLLLVSHRPALGAGGAVARWRAFAPLLQDEGWEIDVVSASDAPPAEFAAGPRFARRSRVMAAARGVLGPGLALAGVRPAAVTPSTTWTVSGARLVRKRLAVTRYDAVYATAPPIAAVLAARLGLRSNDTPFVAEFRDLWAGNPAYEARPGTLDRLERRLLDRAGAIVVVTPEAAESLRQRHPALAERIAVIANGFDPILLERRGPPRDTGAPMTLLHSGTLIADRPLTPLLHALARRPKGELRLILHGYLAPESAAELTAAPPGVDVKVVAPSSWEDAVSAMADADVCVISQAAGAGDATAVAGKVYEYLALGKPVLCLSDGGATEALLRRLGADGLSARLHDPGSIDAALERIALSRLPAPVDAGTLLPYSRATEARQLAALLDEIVAK